jgi:hypothetical protein
MILVYNNVGGSDGQSPFERLTMSSSIEKQKQYV